MAFDLATVGDNCIDRYLPPVGLSTVGGNAVNVAVHLRAHGHRVAYYGAVGDDGNGLRTVALLGETSVDIAHVTVVPQGRTATTDIACGPKGARTFVHEDFGVARGYRPDDGDVAELCRKRHVHIGWLDDGGALRRTLSGRGVSVSQDLSINLGSAHIGAEGLAVAFAAGTDAEAEAEARIAAILAAGARIAVITLGAAGAIACDGRTVARRGIVPTAVVDTLGAGDTFIAGFLDAHLRGGELGRCLEAGRDAAAITCTHYGGFPQPTVPMD
ncbi:MAG: fructoselysine 6-kinase [Alphaproteobacteria bacterium]|nr:fructoselysine 6-kinase [Alphaproteobacteria bacterium]